MKVHASKVHSVVRVENRAGIASSQSNVSMSPLEISCRSKTGCKNIWGYVAQRRSGVTVREEARMCAEASSQEIRTLTSRENKSNSVSSSHCDALARSWRRPHWTHQLSASSSAS